MDNIINSAAKVLGIMRKLKYSMSRSALNQIYITYLLPIFGICISFMGRVHSTDFISFGKKSK